tara:strand:+ start:13307 stop:13738 length:432 start_codon:yes stop_codon:yes gene_type:complete
MTNPILASINNATDEISREVDREVINTLVDSTVTISIRDDSPVPVNNVTTPVIPVGTFTPFSNNGVRLQGGTGGSFWADSIASVQPMTGSVGLFTTWNSTGGNNYSVGGEIRKAKAEPIPRISTIIERTLIDCEAKTNKWLQI